MLSERVPVIGVVEKVAEVVEAVEVRPLEGAEVPVGEGDVEAEECREDDHRDGEENRRQHEQRLLPALAAHQHLSRSRRRPTRRHRHRAPAASLSKPSRDPVGCDRIWSASDEPRGPSEAERSIKPAPQVLPARQRHAAPRSASAGHRRAVTGSPSGGGIGFWTRRCEFQEIGWWRDFATSRNAILVSNSDRTRTTCRATPCRA